MLVHPRSPYTRADPIRSSRRVQLDLDGVVLAEASDCVRLPNTGPLPGRRVGGVLRREAPDHSRLNPIESLGATLRKRVRRPTVAINSILRCTRRPRSPASSCRQCRRSRPRPADLVIVGSKNFAEQAVHLVKSQQLTTVVCSPDETQAPRAKPKQTNDSAASPCRV